MIEYFNCSVMYLYDDSFLVDSNGLNECTDGYWEDPSLKYSNIFDDIFKQNGPYYIMITHYPFFTSGDLVIMIR